MEKFNVVLWTDEMVYCRAAIDRQLQEYGKAWRRTFCADEYGANVARVYLPAIDALRNSLKKIDALLPPIGEK